jgi:ABC transport system ATP-binding/permease protein
VHLLSADRVGAEVEGRTLFAGASFGLSSDDRVAVVGPNGVGKTTLLRIVAGDRAPDEGEVVPRTNLRVAFLAQDPDLTGTTAHDVVVAADPLVRPDEADALLDRVGIDPDQPLATMSGGQHRRVALARTLVAPADLLVLDEPTNHLDVDTIDWLEEELRRRACGLLLVTHDRYVLERLTNRMVDLVPPAPGEPAEVWWHDGSYSSLLVARVERAAARQRATTRARNLLRKEIAWLQRGPRARTSKPRFRREQVEVLRTAAAGDPDARALDLGTGRRRLGDDVFELEDVTVVRGDHTVLDRVDLGIGPGERVGVVGPNGAGKTTLLHVLAGRLTPTGGTVRVGRTVALGLYEQAAGTGLDPTQTVLESVVAVAPHVPLANGETLPAHRLAERFAFDGTLQRTPIGLLSGGERRRVALLHLLVAAPNVLLLDEPTNDLDLDTLATLEDHLDGFAGTLVVASHDRYVLDRLTDRTLEVDGGRIVEHLDVDAYRAAVHARRPAAGATSSGGGLRDAGSSGSPRGGAGGGGSTRSGGGEAAHDNRSRQAARRQVRSLEQRLERLTAQRDDLHAGMVVAATDPGRLLTLQGELAEVERAIAEVEEAWLAAALAAEPPT